VGTFSKLVDFIWNDPHILQAVTFVCHYACYANYMHTKCFHAHNALL